MSSLQDKPLLCSGDVFFATAGTGTMTGIKDAIQTDAFSINPSAEVAEQKSKANDTYGQVRSSIVLPGKTELSMTFLDLGDDPWKYILMGTSAAFSSGAGSVTDEAVTGVLNEWVALANENIDAESVDVEPDGGGTAFTEGTDYKINYRRGWYMALTAGAAVALDVDYDHSAVAGSEINVGDNAQAFVRVIFDGVNLHDNKKVFLDAYRFRPRPSSAPDIKSNQHATGAITGTMETPSGSDVPGVLRLYD